MGSPPSDFPELRFPREDPLRPNPYADPFTPPVSPAVVARRPQPVTRYIVLFLLTLLTTTYAGALHYASFLVGFTDRTVDLPWTTLLLHGCWYSLAILAILGAHEFGHYFACRFYRVDASLPYFIPMPLPLTGTLGAVIRIRQQIPGKQALFDIGIAGPIAGFVVAVPVLFIGMYLSKVVPLPEHLEGGALLGEPLLYKIAEWTAFGSIRPGYDVNLHPMAFAAWFGMLATALNLFPIGQLDGGHISYAVLGRRSTFVTFATVGCLVALGFISSSWWLWTGLTVTMLIAFGPRHPRTYDEEVPLDRTRMWLALFAAIMFILCFTPAPIEPLELVR
jgi:membrane-associated protease RseP (regulator of RpoE activity)